MADTWSMEGEWLKSCNCDPGCPCDFNQTPTQGHCEGVVAMRIERGHYGDVSLDGLHWTEILWWPGRIDQGDGRVMSVIDERADDAQRDALLTILSGRAGGTLFEIFSAVCPHQEEPQFAPFDWDFDLETRAARVRAGDFLDTEVETLRGIDPPDPYRVIVKIPGGFEYTGPDESAETALTKRIRTTGSASDLNYEHTESHATLTRVNFTGAVPQAV